MIRLLPEVGADSPVGSAWEALTRSHAETGLQQSLAWAACRRRQGIRSWHLGYFHGERLLGGAICYAATDPGPVLLVSPEGPVLPWDDEPVAQRGLALLSAAVEQLAADIGAIGWRIEPLLPREKSRLLAGFGRAAIDALPETTMLVDLSGGPEAAIGRMKPKARYNLRLAQRHGVVVRDSKDVCGLYRVLEEAADRQGFFLEPLGYFQALASLLETGHARLLVAEAEGQTLGALWLTLHGRRAVYHYGGTTNRARNAMGGYALHGAAMAAACAAGCAEYDLFGFDPNGDPEHPYAGFSRFKAQFGGRTVRHAGAHERLFLDGLADQVVRALREIGGVL